MPLSAYWHLIRDNRNVRLLWLAQMVSEMGDWFYSVTLYSYLLEITGSARVVALAFFMHVFPQMLASPSAGVLCDRISRRTIMLWADGLRAGIVLLMLLVRSASMIPFLMVLLFLEAVNAAMFEPARNSTIPNIASAEEVPVANALGAATWSAVFSLGPALGGIVAVALGRQMVFVLNAISFVGSALLIRQMKFEEPHVASMPPLRARDLLDFTPIVDGFRYMRGNPDVLAAAMVKGGLGFWGVEWVILPLLGSTVYALRAGSLTAAQAATLGISFLFAARGLGAVVGALLAGTLAGTNPNRLRWTVLAGYLLSAAGFLWLGVAGALAIAVLAVVITNCGASASWTASTTLLQQSTKDQYLGRVFSAEFALNCLTIGLASLVAGQFADAGISSSRIAIVTGMAVFAPTLAWLAYSASKRRRSASHV
jgi:MFS family permease